MRKLVAYALISAAFLFEAVPTIVLATLAVNCTASVVEQETLLPAMRAAWPAVREDVEVAIETLPERDVRRSQLDAMGAALDAGDRATLASAPWAELEQLAGVGIRTRVTRAEIGPGVAASFEERLRNFSAALASYLSGES